MRKCEISRLGGAKDGGKEMTRGRGGVGGSSFFALVVVVICWLVGFLFLFVSLLLNFFCAIIIPKELITDKDRLCGLQCSLQPRPLPQILHLHLKGFALAEILIFHQQQIFLSVSVESGGGGGL